MQAAAYLLLGLAVVGALAYALWQVNARQQRLHAELTRLERLTAEVTMNAEAILDQVDQRIERLNRLAAAIEERAVGRVAGSPPAVESAPTPVPEPAPTPTPEPAQELGVEAPRTTDRYAGLREAVYGLADQGQGAVAIASALGIPRGEVLLMLNLRSRKGPLS